MKKDKLFIGKDKKHYFIVEDDRGNVILRSQGYRKKDSAIKGLNSVKKNVKFEDSIKRNQSASGKYYFNVVAKNGEVVATSPIYHSKTGREGVIKSITS